MAVERLLEAYLEDYRESDVLRDHPQFAHLMARLDIIIDLLDEMVEHGERKRD
jgi:hypothetical protein